MENINLLCNKLFNVMTGEKLKELRTQAGMTQQELAEKLGVSQDRITKWETGRHKISNAYLIILRQMFNV